MTARHDVDRQVEGWLIRERPPAPPEGLLEAVTRGVEATSRRPGWQIADRWTWRHGARLRVAARTFVLVVVIAALLAAALGIVALVGSTRPAPPFGLTRAGFIAFDTADGIVVERANGTDRHVIVKPDGQSISPTWSRDGLRLAYWHRPDKAGSWDLLVVNPDGSGSSTIAEGMTLREREQDLDQPSNIAWSPDSRQIAFAGDVEGGQGIFVATLGLAAARLVTDPALKAIDPAWSPDGSVIAFQSQQTETLHVVAPNGSGEHQLASLPHTFLWPDWSPDGSRITTMAFVPNPNDPQTGQTDIFTVSANGANVTNISRDPADDFSPSWSPDGARLAWDRVPADKSARAFIVVTRLDSPNVVEIRIDADLAPPVWSPDGTRIFSYVQGSNGTFHELVVIDPEGVAPVVRLPADGNVGNGNWQRLPGNPVAP
jgi:Tol biopolymer transport system component